MGALCTLPGSSPEGSQGGRDEHQDPALQRLSCLPTVWRAVRCLQAVLWLTLWRDPPAAAGVPPGLGASGPADSALRSLPLVSPGRLCVSVFLFSPCRGLKEFLQVGFKYF